jgi:adenylate cyclase
VFELKKAGAVRTRFDVSRARGLTRFVGRDADFQTLETALAEAREGNGQVVGLVADAGVGKSRLSFEFLESCRARGLRTLEGRAVPHGKNIPLLPILQAFREYFDIDEHEIDRQVREKIAGRMLLFDEQYRDDLPLMFDFFGVPDPERPAPRMDPEARQRQLFGVLRRSVQRDNTEGTVVTLIEDLHWLDGASEAWLSEWVDVHAGSQNLLVVNFRPEYSADWMRKPWYRQLPLRPLGPEAIRELLADLLGEIESVDALADKIHERTAGNPFFAEEVVRGLVESGHLEGERGSYRVVTPVDRIQVPTSVHDLLAARIDKLPEEDKRVLQTAAVLGKDFLEPILAEVAERAHDELGDVLQRLKAADFIYEESLYPVAEYAFKHPLTQEVALGSQLQERRRTTHAAVARAIEDFSATKLDEAAPLLAHHWEEAGESVRAAHWLQRASDWVGRSDPLQAAAYMQRVLELTEDLEASSERDALRLEACRRVSQGGWRTGLSPERAEVIFREGCEIAERTGDRDRGLTLRTGYGATLGFQGDITSYARLAREGLALIDDSTPPGTAAALFGPSCGYSSFLLGDLEESLVHNDRAHELSRGDPNAGVDDLGFSVWGQTLQLRAEVLAWLGRLDEALEGKREGILVSREHDMPEALAWALGTSAELAEWRGEYAPAPYAEEVRRNAIEATEIAERLGSPFSRSHAYRGLGCAHMLHGDFADATEVLELALSIAREHSGLEREPQLLTRLSRASLGSGDADRALSRAEEAIATARRYATRAFEAEALVALADVLLARGDDADRIATALDQAEALIEATAAGVLAPRLAEVRSRLAAARGDDAGAAALLDRARVLHAECGAAGHVARLAAD